VQLVRVHDGVAFPDRAPDGDGGVVVVTPGRDLVHREPCVAAPAAVDGDACLVGGGERQGALGECFALLAAHGACRSQQRTQTAHAFRPVLITLIPRCR